MTADAAEAAVLAAKTVGFDTTHTDVIRAGENTLVRLPARVIARVTRPGQEATAAKEIRVARWLEDIGIPVVHPVVGIDEPVLVGDRAVTFWDELPPHQPGSPADIADMLRLIHSTRVPAGLHLPPLAPFVRIAERIAEATWLPPDDQTWLLSHLAGLEETYRQLPPGRAVGAVHGDAWSGNVVITRAGPILLDLERFSIGPPEWDLTSVAVDHFTFGTVTADQWQHFCDRYGCDVTTWPGFTVLRDARELRKVTFAIQMACQFPQLRGQAERRIACVRGRVGPRPWNWIAVP